jgi:nucleotide-binding universal stress UspA family protein
METQGKGSQMRSVVCGIDESGSHEAVTAAVNHCRENRTSLRLVGIVRDKLSDTTTVIAGERIRRSKTVRLELNRAAEAARAAGVPVSMILRAGNPVPELIREAAATGSGEVFYVGSRGLIRAALTRQPRRELMHLSESTPTNEQLAAAA